MLAPRVDGNDFLLCRSKAASSSFAVHGKLKGYTASALPVSLIHDITEIPPFAAVFRFKSGRFVCKIEDYSAICGFTFEQIRSKFKDNPFAGEAIKGAILERLNQVVEQIKSFEPYFEAEYAGDAKCKDQLFRTLANRFTAKTPENGECLKLSKANGRFFGLLQTANLYLNTGYKLCNPSMKVVKMGVEGTGEEIVILKPNFKAPDPEGCVRNWQTEVVVWKALMEMQQQNADLTGLLVPKEVIESSNPKKSRAIFAQKAGDLIDLVNDRDAFGKIEYSLRLKMCFQITYGLFFSHTKLGVANKDLKPENVLYEIYDDGDVDCYVCDWGFSSKIGKFRMKLDGSPGYVPPEYMFEKNIDIMEIDGESWDAWALGVVLWLILKGNLPDFVIYGINKEWDNYYTYMEAFYRQPEAPENTMEGIACRLMRKDPKDRWSVAYALSKIEQLYRGSSKRLADSAQSPAPAAKKLKKVRSMI